MIVKLPTLGLVCPFPLVEAKEAMAKLNKGDGLEIEFDSRLSHPINTFLD